MKRRVLLTGATGFVGANLARRLLREGHDVHLLVRPQHAAWRIREIRSHVRIHSAALNQPLSLQRTLKNIRPEWIFHLAAYGAYSTQNDAQTIFQTNILGTHNLLEACARIGFDAFIHAGSSSEYGYQDHAPKESAPALPNSLYALSKLSATQLCRYFAVKNRLSISTLRLYSVYGPYEEPTRLIPTLIVQGLKGKFPPLVNPRIARDFVYSEDVCDAFLRAAEVQSKEWGAVYNVGTGIQTTLGQVVQVAKKVFSIKDKPRWESMPNRSWDTTCWIANPSKIQKQLRWSAGLSFASGLERTVEWLRTSTWLPYYQKHIQ